MCRMNAQDMVYQFHFDIILEIEYSFVDLSELSAFTWKRLKHLRNAW